MKKNLIYSFIGIFLLGTFSFVFIPHVAHADVTSTIAGALFGYNSIVDFIQQAVLTLINTIVIPFFGTLLWIASVFFNICMYLTLNISDLVSKIPTVDIGWSVFRDIANMCFIFILLYIAIETILQGGSFQTKTLVRNVIIVAIFINFSLFLTKVVIDSSNIVALGFYNRIAPDAISITNPTTWGGGITQQFMNALKIQTYADATGGEKRAYADGSFGGTTATNAKNQIKMIVITTFAAITMLVTAFVFFAGGILLLIRTGSLIFLMVLSPIAFVSWILPGTKRHTSRWWNALISQAFFAPAYMIMLYIVLRTINNPGFKTAFSLNNAGTLADAFSGAGNGSVALILNIFIVLFLIVGSLIVAKELGAHGASTVVGWGNKARGVLQSFAGRNTIGRAGASLDKMIGDTRFGRSALGGSVREATTGALSTATFGGKYSVKSKQEKREKEIESYLKKNTDKPDKIASYIRELNGNERNYAYKNLSPKLRVQVDSKLNATPAGTPYTTPVIGSIPQIIRPVAPAGADIVAQQQGRLSNEEKEKTMMAYLKEHQGNTKVLADYIMSLKNKEEQSLAYEKLSPRDRASLEPEFAKMMREEYGPTFTALPPTEKEKVERTLGEKLRSNFSPEEKEKTEKAIRELAKNSSADEAEKLIKKLVTAMTAVPRATSWSVDGVTYDKNAIKDRVQKVPPKDIQEYSTADLKTIAELLSKKQLEAIEKNNAISSIEFDEIKTKREDAIKIEWKIPPADVKLKIGQLDSPAVAKLVSEIGAGPTGITTYPEIVKNLEIKDLAAMVKEGIKKNLANEIKQTILDLATNSAAALTPEQQRNLTNMSQWFDVGAGKDLL